ncbi:MAG: hypothetical protein ABEK10_02620 [Candidatus Nanosalina sp.]
MEGQESLRNQALEELQDLTETEDYQELIDDVTLSGDTVTPDAVSLGDRAILYLQVHSTRGEQRYVIGEYRQGDEELGPVPLDEEQLESTLEGAGPVEIREDLLEPREINYREQVQYRS